MATFPRVHNALPRLSAPPRFPGGMQSWGDAGRGQTRAVMNMGRQWEEVYPVLDTAVPAVRALIRAINQSLREGPTWDVQIPYWHKRHGVGGGSPLVKGASQTGNSLLVDGAPTNITGWLCDGDLIKVTGPAVVLDVAGDVNTDGSGNATIPISPPIFVGQSPADNAPVTIDPTAIVFKAIIVNVGDFPPLDLTGYIEAGLTIAWREQPV